MNGKWNLDEGFRVGEWAALPRPRTLTRDDETIHPEPKVMDVLVCLARHHPDIVTRDQFAKEVWPEVIVSDEVLTRAIHLLRMHLGDDPKAARYIQTISGRGYRLISDIAPLVKEEVAFEEPELEITPATNGAANGSDATHADSLRQPRLPVLITLAVFLAATAGGIGWLFHADAPVATPPPPRDIHTIAVLPFDTGPGDSEVFGDGLADEIRVSLNTIPTLRIIPGMSVQTFKGPQDDPIAIGRKLNAGSLLMGSVRQDGDRLKVTVRLIDSNSGIQSWSESYAEQRIADLFKLQHDISRAVATQLKVKFEPTATPPTNDPVAYTEFLQARLMLHRRGPAPIESSIKLFNQVIERDPKFGRAYVGLAEALIVAPSYTGEPEAPMYDRATAALDHADSLGATQPPVHAIRAYIDTRRWLWFDAAKEFDIARSTDPNDSDLWQYYSQFLAYTGDFIGATDAALEATRLDPLSPIAHQRLGVMYLWQDDYQRAGHEFEMADALGLPSEANPEITVALLLWMKQFDQARTRLIAIQRIRHKSDAWVAPAVKAVAHQGDEAKGIAALHSAHANGAINDRLYLGALMLIGDPESFFSAIEDAVANHVPFDVEIMFLDRSSGLRRQPRFAALMEQIGLVKYWDANHWPPACARNGSLVECH